MFLADILSRSKTISINHIKKSYQKTGKPKALRFKETFFRYYMFCKNVFWEFRRPLDCTAAAVLPKQARETFRKHFTKPFSQPDAPDCIAFCLWRMKSSSLLLLPSLLLGRGRCRRRDGHELLEGLLLLRVVGDAALRQVQPPTAQALLESVTRLWNIHLYTGFF